MLRLVAHLFLAHIVASYAVVAGVTARFGGPGADMLLLAPAWAAYAVWDVTTDPFRFGPSLGTAVTVDGCYVAGFVATLAVARRQRRKSVRSRRRANGLCGECGYDLTGNKSGTCPECGMHVVPKARLMLRRGG